MCPMPSFFSQCSISSSAPRSRHEIFRAHLNVKFSARLGGQHRVIADHVAHIEFGQFQPARDFGDDFVREKPSLVLRVKQRRNQHRPLRRIMRQHLRKARFELVGKTHEISAVPAGLDPAVFCSPGTSVPGFQIPPLRDGLVLIFGRRPTTDGQRRSTGQSLPAQYQCFRSLPPRLPAAGLRTSSASVCMLARHAERMCTRYGFAEPSLTM